MRKMYPIRFNFDLQALNQTLKDRLNEPFIQKRHAWYSIGAVQGCILQ